MEYGKVELTGGEQPLTEVKIQNMHLPGRLTDIYFCNDTNPCKLSKWTGGYKFTKSEENINPLLYVDA